MIDPTCGKEFGVEDRGMVLLEPVVIDSVGGTMVGEASVDLQTAQRDDGIKRRSSNRNDPLL
jgi:hypothetical protein